jgi:hypothetical protein
MGNIMDESSSSQFERRHAQSACGAVQVHKRLNCPFCKRSYPTEPQKGSISIEQHIVQKHPIRTCHKCNKEFYGKHTCYDLALVKCPVCSVKHRRKNESEHCWTCVPILVSILEQHYASFHEYLFHMSQAFKEKKFHTTIGIIIGDFPETVYTLPSKVFEPLITVFKIYTNCLHPKHVATNTWAFKRSYARPGKQLNKLMEVLADFRSKLNANQPMVRVKFCDCEEKCKCEIFEMSTLEYKIGMGPAKFLIRKLS